MAAWVQPPIKKMNKNAEAVRDFRVKARLPAAQLSDQTWKAISDGNSLESFKLYPQVRFLPVDIVPKTSDRSPINKYFVLDFVHRLVLRARRRRSDSMISGIAIEYPEIEEDLFSVPPFHNASQRRPGAIPWWESMYTGFDSLGTIAGLDYEPVPHRLMGDCPVIYLACQPTSPNGVPWLLDVILDRAIEASPVRAKAELEKFWIKSEMGWKRCEADLS
ncbi:hypothetical protein B0J17DRAFT_732878 [Rhizoctonia solani]|nr:hypothetical protein B0J17DRAFT_732878 [Rhizoctonia solani]